MSAHDQAAPELRDQLRQIYRIGPAGAVEPEFSYRDFRNSGFQTPIKIGSALVLADRAAPSAQSSNVVR